MSPFANTQISQKALIESIFFWEKRGMSLIKFLLDSLSCDLKEFKQLIKSSHLNAKRIAFWQKGATLKDCLLLIILWDDFKEFYPPISVYKAIFSSFTVSYTSPSKIMNNLSIIWPCVYTYSFHSSQMTLIYLLISCTSFCGSVLNSLTLNR